MCIVAMEYDSIDMGRRIAYARKRCGFTQLELAEDLYVSISYISKIESGVREPSFAFMVRMSELTATSLDYLIAGKKETSDAKVVLQKAIATLRDLEKQL